MAYLGNSPTKGETVLRLEGRKSFSFGLWIKDPRGAAIDITGCTIRFVMKALPLSATDTEDETNLVANSEADLVEPEIGYARFDMQATDLDAAAGEYPFAVVLTTQDGYSAVIVKGIVDLLPNVEFASLGTTYIGANPPVSLEVVLRGMTSIEVLVGGMLPPLMGFLSDADKARLDELVVKVLQQPDFGSAAYRDETYFAPAAAVVPAGGFTGRVLGKLSSDDYDIGWINLATGGGGGDGLDATGIPSGYVPTADGAGLWEWQPAVANADDLTDGVTLVVMTAVERAKLAAIAAGAEVNVQADWNAVSGDAAIQNKPTLGTAAAEDVEAFADANHTHRLLDLDGVTRGTTTPSGGVDGDFYIRYTP